MKIEELDEFQGVTPQMVRVAAEARGFIYRDSVLHYPDGKVALFFATNPHLQGHVVALIAGHLKLSPQLFLREINPRLRKELPSEEAIEAHRSAGGLWIAAHGVLGDGGSICLISFYFDDGRDHRAPFKVWDGDEWLDAIYLEDEDLSEWSFWPCDSAGNKVRWPETKPAGVDSAVGAHLSLHP